MTKPHIAIAGFQHETNTFNPQKTPLVDFEKADGWPAATYGHDVFDVFDPLNIAMSGFLDARDLFQLHPIFWCSAEPGGMVTDEAFEYYAERLIAGIKGLAYLDGVLLDLHGAMVTESYPDGELEIVRRVRDVIGPDIPLVIALDFHANLSPDCVDLCDAITIYREYPHLDMRETGHRAALLMDHLLKTGQPLFKAFHQVPYLIPTSAQATIVAPLDGVFSDFNALQNDGVTSVDAAAGFAPADIWHCGPSVLAYGIDEGATQAAAQQLYDRFMTAKAQFEDNLLSEKEAIQKAADILKNAQKPVVIGDVQDNPGAGASSDTTGILDALIAEDLCPSILGILSDANAVAKAWDCGIGGQFEAALGAATFIKGLTRQTHRYETIMLSDHPILCTGEMYGGTHADLGRMAVIQVVGTDHTCRIVIAEGRFQCVDQALLRAMNLDLDQPQIIVVKSTAHFRADFDPIAQETLLVASPGLHPCHLGKVGYKNLRPGLGKAVA